MMRGYDVVVVMQDGEVMEVGPSRELLRREGGGLRSCGNVGGEVSRCRDMTNVD